MRRIGGWCAAALVLAFALMVVSPMAANAPEPGPWPIKVVSSN
ncbi:MAG: hypothetical protein OWT27_02865 [Firmicutes bacterium]|nr:hypothetical protein [Bacillota bacterium]